jgi:cell division protein FtsX
VIRGLQYFVSEAFLSLWRGRRSSALSILTIAIALFMLGLFLLLGANLQRVVDEWRQSAEFSVYLRDEAAQPERDAVRRALAEHPAIAGIDAVSKEDALERFRRTFPELSPATVGAPENPFPASFEARLTSSAVDVAALGKLAERIGAMPGVADVRYDRKWLDRLSSVSACPICRPHPRRRSRPGRRPHRWPTSSGCALRAARRGGDHGAGRRPDGVHQGPFVCEGSSRGIGAVLALAALRIVLGLAASTYGVAGGMFDVHALTFISWASTALVVAGGMVVGCVGGLVAARRLR